MFLGLLWLAGGCVGTGDKDAETAETGLTCPYDVETFCAFEFGGTCPTYEEAAAMTCDGYHFDPTGTTGEAPNATDGDKECIYPIVSCHVSYDPNLRTRLYFTGEGSGTIHMVDLIWTEDPVCRVDGVFGDFIDC